ncbi:hypothetical protein ACFVYA_36245 [Amycolatopsis sp. NPDC058278]|uniref:hypothetical protein n=1 Tax=Amycolatopsis sp. NPDC058278 TaxID=3346417 RepID=UPI0036D7FB89
MLLPVIDELRTDAPHLHESFTALRDRDGRNLRVGHQDDLAHGGDHLVAWVHAVPVAEFNAYLDRENTDPAADLVGYRQHAVWLSRGELEEMIGELRRVLLPRLINQPTPERAQYLLSPILFPIEQPTTNPAETD